MKDSYVVFHMLFDVQKLLQIYNYLFNIRIVTP